MEKRIFGFKRNVFFLGLVSLLNDFSNQMIQSVMPVFLSVTLGVGPAGIGMIEGAADALASFLKIFSGWFSDKLGKRKLPAFFGYALSVAVRPFFAFARSYGQIFGLRAIDRIGKGFRDAPRDALLSESAGREEVGRSFGFNRMMDAMGGILGPLGAIIILPLVGMSYPSLFWIAFGIGLFVLTSFFFIKEVGKIPDGKVRLDLSIFRESKEFTFLLVSIFIFGLGALPITLMLLRPISGGLHLGSVPVLYFVYSIFFVLAAIPLGRLSDRVGGRIIMAIGFVFAIAAYILLASSANLLIAFIAFAIFGLYSAATDGIERALAAKLVNPAVLATGQGFLNAAVGISSFLAGLAGGLIWAKFSAPAAFTYGAIMAFIGLGVFIKISFFTKKLK